MLPMLFTYLEAFKNGNIGYAAAMGVVLVVVSSCSCSRSTCGRQFRQDRDEHGDVIRCVISSAGHAQYVALCFYIVFLGFPLLWLISASLKSSGELNSLSVSLIPQDIEWGNYSAALERQGLVRVGVELHGRRARLDRARAPHRAARRVRPGPAQGPGPGMGRRVDPGQPGVPRHPHHPAAVPHPADHRPDGLPGRPDPGAHVYTLPFALWMLQGYVRSIPIELEEAGSMDGASRLTVLRTIVFPLLMPGVVATAMFSFVSSWNEFFFALVLLQSPENYTLPITLKMFIGGEGKVALGPLAAGAVLAAIPSIVFFSIMQKRLTGGLLSGAVKG